MPDLKETVEAWVRAEYHFRCGPNAYQAPEAAWFEKAQRKLRRALTGTGDVADAFAIVNGEEMPDRGRVKRKKVNESIKQESEEGQ